MVQSLIAPDTSGRYETLVPDALLTPAAARKLSRSAAHHRGSGDRSNGSAPTGSCLTVTYTLNGLTKTRQAIAGERLVLTKMEEVRSSKFAIWCGSSETARVPTGLFYRR